MNLQTNMVLEQSSSKGPHTCKHKVELIELTGRVRRGVFISQQAVQQTAQGLMHKNNRHTLKEQKSLAIYIYM